MFLVKVCFLDLVSAGEDVRMLWVEEECLYTPVSPRKISFFFSRDVALLFAARSSNLLPRSPLVSSWGSTALIVHFVMFFHVVDVRWLGGRQASSHRTLLFLYFILTSLSSYRSFLCLCLCILSS